MERNGKPWARNKKLPCSLATQTHLEITKIIAKYVHLLEPKRKTRQSRQKKTDTSAYLTSGSCASRRDLLGGEGTTTASSMILRLFGFCSQRVSQTNGGAYSRWRRTKEAEAGVASHQWGRGLGGLLDDGEEVAQVERLHLALVLLLLPPSCVSPDCC